MAASKKKDPNFPMQGKTGGMGGTYGSKSENLSKKVLKKAGAAKVAAKRTVSVSDTRREGSRTLGPGGKPLSGTVVLANGAKAVYKNGRRVQAADARSKPKAPAARASSRPSAVVNPTQKPTKPAQKPSQKPAKPTAGQSAAGARYAAQAGRPAASSSTGKPAGTTTAAWNALSPAQKRQFIANAAKYGRAAGLNPARIAAAAASGGQNSVVAKAVGSGGGTPPRGQTGQVYVNGKWVSGTSAAAKANGPKVGDIKQTMSGRAKWDGSKWVKF